MSPRACSSKGRTGIPGQNISSWGQKYDLKICPEAETICPKMTIRPLDEQAPSVEKIYSVSLRAELFSFWNNFFIKKMNLDKFYQKVLRRENWNGVQKGHLLIQTFADSDKNMDSKSSKGPVPNDHGIGFQFKEDKKMNHKNFE